MKSHLHLLVLALSACSIVRGGDSSTNLLSFHLLVDTTGWAAHMEARTTNWHSLINNPAELRSVKLLPTPLLADRDFVSYDTTNHIFAVTAEAARRVLSTLGADDAPFVLLVSGQPICVGVFSRPTSSALYSVPRVLPERLAIGPERTNDFHFLIETGFGPRPGLHAERSGVDPWSDSRILAAVRKLGLDALAKPLALLVCALDDPDADVRDTALEFLVREAPETLTNKEALALFAAGLRSADLRRNNWAAQALYAAGQRARGEQPDLKITNWNVLRREATNILRQLAP